MAKFCDVNNTATGGLNNAHQVPIFALKTQLKAAGWTIPRSSDGITYNAAGDQITHAGIGAGGLSNNGAWFVAEEPGGRRQWCFQLGAAVNSSTQMRVKYSALAKFTGGSPAYQRVPSATDEQTLAGSGTDAAPTYASILPTNTYRYHIVANSVAVGGAYYFCLFTTQIASATQGTGLIFQEPMFPGSYSSADGDPVIVQCNTSSGGPSNPSAWFGFGTGAQVWQPTGLVGMAGPSGLFGTLGGDIGSNLDVNGKPWWYATVSAAYRIKGIGAFLASKGPTRTYPATLNSATDAYVYLGVWAYPYADNVVPSIA